MKDPVDTGWYRVLHVVGKLFSKLGAFTQGSERMESARQNERLRQDVEAQWSRLLDRHRGHVVSRAEPSRRIAFDFAQCEVQCADLDLLVYRGRGEIRVMFRTGGEGVWQDLGFVLANTGKSVPNATDSLYVWQDALQENWPLLLQSRGAEL